MNNFITLLVGELQRMLRYHIFGAGFVVSLIWLLVLHFTETIGVNTVLPLLLFFDAVSMSVLLVGVMLFFEKQEGAIRSLQVSPISRTEQILAKTGGNILSNVQTLVILYLYAWFLKDTGLSFLVLLAAILLASFAHSMMGFLLAYRARGFTEMLMGLMAYSFIFVIPVIFEHVGLIQGGPLKYLLYLLPTRASLVLINAAAGGMETSEVLLAAVYLVALSVVLLHFVLKKFNEFALKESGV